MTVAEIANAAADAENLAADAGRIYNRAVGTTEESAALENVMQAIYQSDMLWERYRTVWREAVRANRAAREQLTAKQENSR